MLPTLGFAQTANKSRIISEDSMIRKWQAATLNIEVRSTHADQSEIVSPLLKKTKGFEQMKVWDSLGSIGYISRGTAIYVENNNKHFIITARHLVEDALSKDSGMICSNILLIENGNLISEKEHMKLPLVRTPPDFSGAAYIFSSRDDDLAIISLDSKISIFGEEFMKTLNKSGYKPISITDIDTICNLKKGETIYAFGFPDLSVLGQRIYKNWVERWIK